ncbi:MAG: hypothetical protein WEA24_08625 [Gemmatimonadota bacterium]
MRRKPVNGRARAAAWSIAAAMLLYTPAPIWAQTSVLVARDTAPLWGYDAWQIDSDPIVSIGVADGPEEQILVNVFAAGVLSDGTIVVVDFRQGFFKVRYYDDAGLHLVSVGSWGGGPGETRSLAGAHFLPGDSLLVLGYDRRFTVFGPRGQVGRTGLIPGSAFMTGATILDGTRLAMDVSDQDNGSLPERPELRRVQRGFRILDTLTGERIWVEQFPGKYYYRTSWGTVPYPFSPSVWTAAGRGHLWVGQSEVGSIQGYNRAGRHQVTIEAGRAASSVTDEHQRRYVELVLDGLSGDRLRRMETALRYVDFPRTLPHFRALSVDADGNLWVLRYSLPWHRDLPRWDVYNYAGRWLTSVAQPATIPVRFRSASEQTGTVKDLLDIGRNYVLAIVHDDMGVQRVQLHKMRR